MPQIGASGAIAGIMGAYLVWCRHSEVTLLVPVIIVPLPVRIPAVLFLLAWVGYQWFCAWATYGGDPHFGGIGWWAHIGGFAAGVLGAFLIRPLQEYEVKPARLRRSGMWRVSL